MLEKQNRKLDDSGVQRRDAKFAGAAGELPLRIYTPDKVAIPGAALLYFHDGGFVLDDLDDADRAAYALARKAGIVVVSADYRRAPEAKFPAAHDDAFAAYQWLAGNAPSIGADRRRLAIGGEGAGGNLAANTTLRARVSPVPSPIYQLLIHPIAART